MKTDRSCWGRWFLLLSCLVACVCGGDRAADPRIKDSGSIAGNSARGTVHSIPPGAHRLFTLNAYDTSGTLTHTGSAASDISAGRTAQVRISLRAVSGNADVIRDFGDAPLFEKANQLVGTWSLELPGIDDERFEFTYTFEADGNFPNRIGGAFLSALQELDEFRDLDLGQLDQFDGGTVVLTGTWRPGDGTLGLDYEEMQLELFASLPLLGNITIGILQEDLGTGAETSTTFDCACVDRRSLWACRWRKRPPARSRTIPPLPS